MILQIDELKLYNPGVISSRLPVRVFSEFTQDLQAQMDNSPEKFNTELAGNLEKEYRYNLIPSVEKCLSMLVQDYQVRFNYFSGKNFNFHDSWVNIQQRYECNPLHTHFGDLSWVIWVTIPYDLNEEINVPSNRDSNTPTASLFEFVYNRLDGGITTHKIQIDNTYEGMIIMFPSYLQHQVYSFSTSDQYRISVAGNITFIKDTEKE